MEKTALILVDMLNDFVTGSLGCDRSKALAPRLTKLLKAARLGGVHVIYANDAHIKGLDKELELWGDHAIAGTEGAEIVAELAAQAGDFIIPKRRYSGFFQTDMQLLLTELRVDTLVLTGLHAHMCVRHTAADAYYWGYKILVPKDGVDSFTEEDYTGGISYLKDVYGAAITDIDSLCAEWSKQN